MYTGLGNNDPLLSIVYALTVYNPGGGSTLLDDGGQDTFITLFSTLLYAVQYVSFKNTKHPIDCEQEMKVQVAFQGPDSDVQLKITSDMSCVVSKYESKLISIIALLTLL